MSEEAKCPKCGGNMKDGQITTNVTSDPTAAILHPNVLSQTLSGQLSPFGPSNQGAGVTVEGPIWREESEKEAGWIIKRKEKKDFSIRGMRCLSCGYIELFIEL